MAETRTTVAPLTDDDIDAMDARATGATPGPWHVVEEWVGGVGRDGHYPFIKAADGSRIAEAELDGDDASFIAHARADVPALIAETRRARHERGALAEAIADAAYRRGIYNGETALTGPDLLLLAQHLGER